MPDLPPCSPSAPGNYSFTASNGKVYLLSTYKRSQADAETFCQTQGGHLVGYRSSSEQRMVEQYFVGEGLLLPTFHSAYHLGLQKTGSSWVYTDFFMRGSTYFGWDRLMPGSTGTCAVANCMTPRNGIFAYNDADCAVQRPHICVISRAWLPLWCWCW